MLKVWIALLLALPAASAAGVACSIAGESDGTCVGEWSASGGEGDCDGAEWTQGSTGASSRSGTTSVEVGGRESCGTWPDGSTARTSAVGAETRAAGYAVGVSHYETAAHCGGYVFVTRPTTPYPTTTIVGVPCIVGVADAAPWGHVLP